jgi:hypothetical protein
MSTVARAKPSKNKISLALRVVMLLVATSGAMVAAYVGLPMVIAIVLVLLIGLPLFFLTSGRRRQLAPAAALQAGHGLYSLIAAIAIGAGGMKGPPGLDVSMIFFESMCYLCCAFLIVIWPNVIPIILLTVYQAALLIINGVQLADPQLKPDMQAIFVMHIFLRIAGLILMYTALLTSTADPSQRTTPRKRTDSPDDLEAAATRQQKHDEELDPDQPQRKRPPQGSKKMLAAVITAVVGIAAGFGLALYLLTRDDQPRSVAPKPKPRPAPAAPAEKEAMP